MITKDLLNECPLMDLEDHFPESGFVGWDPKSGKYCCYCCVGVHGLAYFEHKSNAEAWIRRYMIDLNPNDSISFEIQSVTFDEAREIAKGRPHPVTAVILLDDMLKPLIHYVK